MIKDNLLRKYKESCRKPNKYHFAHGVTAFATDNKYFVASNGIDKPIELFVNYVNDLL